MVIEIQLDEGRDRVQSVMFVLEELAVERVLA
jgi:hypothetical protein